MVDAGLTAAERITEALFSGDPSALGEADLEQLAMDGLPAEQINLGDVPADIHTAAGAGGRRCGQAN